MIDFPLNPTPNVTTHTVGRKTWKCVGLDGTGRGIWDLTSTPDSFADQVALDKQAADQAKADTQALLALLPGTGGDAQMGTIRPEAGAVTETQQAINRQVVRITSFLTPAQRTAMQTNDWSGIDITTFTAAVQSAINAAKAKELIVPTPAYWKVNKPLVWPSFTTIRGQGLPARDLGLNIYPDLSVNWPALYPDMGVLTAEQYLAGDPAYPGVVAAFWTGVGKNIQVRADLDVANYAAFRSRVPDYGIVIWAPNESVFFEHVQVLRFRKQNWLCGGFASVPTFLHCNAFYAGEGQDTVFGDAVTRPASPFAQAVTVYWDVNATTAVQLEAATNTDLDSIVVGDSLTINGTAYNVAGLPSATTAINDRTIIAGVVTTARFYRRVTLSANVTANGRNYPCGIAFKNHPKLNFAPGVAAAAGGRGSGGSARLLGFSGDQNSSLIFMNGSQNLLIAGPKSEANNNLVHISGSANGGGRGRVDISGYRADGFGTFDGGLIRITGSARPSVLCGTGQLVGYTNVLVDQSGTGAAESLTAASLYGQGFLYHCADGSEMPSLSKARIGLLTIGDGVFSVPILDMVDGSDAVNRRMRWTCSNAADIYRFQVGPNNSSVFTVGANTGNNAFFWAYNGATTEKLLKLFNSGGAAAIQIGQSAAQKVSFFGAAPVVQQTLPVAATDAASTQTLANALRTALINLGLAA